MLKVGDKMPNFSVVNQDCKEISQENFEGRKTVFFFYPQANTPTCTVEACNIRDHYSELIKDGFTVVGISADSVKKQKNFHSKYNFPYDVLADEELEIISRFGVWQEKTTFGRTYMGIIRSTFIFDENNICTKVITKVKSKDAVAQILEK